MQRNKPYLTRSFWFLWVSLCFIWTALTLADIKSFWLGLPVITGITLLCPTRAILPVLSLQALGKFAIFFIVNSIKGAFDISRRALSPSLPIRPALIEYPFYSKSELRTVTFVNTLSLLPGTLGAQVKNDAIMVHVMNDHDNMLGEINQLNNVIEPLFESTETTGENNL